MLLLWILAIENPFPECTATTNGWEPYKFQTVIIAAGDCFATSDNAMIGTDMDKDKYKVSYRTYSLYTQTLSEEIQYEEENPLF